MPGYARVLALVVLAPAALAVLTTAQPAGRAHPAAGAGPAAVAATGNAADGFHSVRSYPTVAAPVRLRIPALHVDTRLQRLGLAADGTVAVPSSPDVAGWYDGGPRPGQDGPAVLLGHVDSKSGPGVFAELSRVRPGAVIQVDLADGSTVTFRVTKLQRVPKVSFPTDLVYAPTLDPTLRLVTCGGSFDHARGSYRDNVIAFADQT